jgi:hypothetical protein
MIAPRDLPLYYPNPAIYTLGKKEGKKRKEKEKKKRNACARRPYYDRMKRRMDKENLSHPNTSILKTSHVIRVARSKIQNSEFRKFFFKIRKPSEIFFEKSETNQKEQFFAK